MSSFIKHHSKTMELLTLHTLLTFFLYIVISQCGADTLSNIQDLHDKLFVDDKYNVNIRGIFDQTKVVKVGANLTLISLVEIDEREEVMETMVLLDLVWIDDRLMWKPKDYNGTMNLTIYQNAIWKPEVKLSNPMDAVGGLGDARTKVRIYNNGRVVWTTPNVFRARCDINVASFPWDRQLCLLQFVVSDHLANEVLLEVDRTDIKMDLFTQNKAWTITRTFARSTAKTTSKVEFGVCIERRSTFHLAVVFFPTVMLSFLNLFVFLIRVDSGERISFSITLMLSITLYLSLIATNLPKHSEGMASMIYCLDFVLLESMNICIVTILSQHIYYKQDAPSARIQMIVSTLLRRGSRQVQSGSQLGGYNEYIDDTDKEQDVHTVKEERLKDSETMTVTWTDVSLLLDRSGFCAAFLAILSSFIIFAYHIVRDKIEC